MADFDRYTVLFTCFYMPCDSSNNCGSFNSAIGAFQTLRARHGPNYVICGGDFNVQLSRSHSNQTIMFEIFCSAEDLISAHTIGNQVEYTYCSDFNKDVRTTIDHFVTSTNLSDRINKHCIIEDVENRSDHVPLYIDITMPISLNYIDDTCHFVPKPIWHFVTLVILYNYKGTFDELLGNCTNPDDVLSCNDIYTKQATHIEL